MSVATEIQRLQLAKDDIKSAIIEKGGTIEDGALIDTYGDTIRLLDNAINYAPCFDFRNYNSKQISIRSESALSYCIENNHAANVGFFDGNTFIKKCIAMFPNATVGRYAFRNCINLIYIKFDASNMKDTNEYTAYNRMFFGCKKLETIDTLIDGTNCSFKDATFADCINLKDVRFVLLSIKSNVSFAQSSLLTDESIQSIIDGLADLTGQATQTLAFHADVKAKLTEEQIATITSKNWTLA